MTIALVLFFGGRALGCAQSQQNPELPSRKAPNLGLNGETVTVEGPVTVHRGLGSASAAYACLDGHSLERKRIEYKQGSGLCKS